MKKIHTHYDNLKVSRNAPQEVIQAAYRVLSKKYHPDLNQGNKEAERIMAIINASYEVLSNKEKRREHDEEIKKEESISALNNENTYKESSEIEAPLSQHVGKKELFFQNTMIKSLINNLMIYGIIGFLIFCFSFFEKKNEPLVQEERKQQEQPKEDPYVREDRAPNGKAWPIGPNYLKGVPQKNTDGLSTVTIDNTENSSDVFVKLVSVFDQGDNVVREFYVPSSSRFTLKNITMGRYNIRYKDLSNGKCFRSESFDLEEVLMKSSIQYSNITITLYKVKNGNMHTYDIPKTAF